MARRCSAIQNRKRGESTTVSKCSAVGSIVRPSEEQRARRPMATAQEEGLNGAILSIEQENLRRIDITDNLGDFLFCFLRNWQHTAQWEDNIPLLWIDAICIDQTNAGEKTAQIDLMGDIYERSSSTMLWLGMDETDLDSVHFFVDKVLPPLEDFSFSDTFPRIEDFYEWAKRNRPADARFWQTNFGLAPMPGRSWLECWHAYCRFFKNRHWFHRGWVLQECGLSQYPDWCAGRAFEQIPSDAIFSISRIVAFSSWDDQLFSALDAEFLGDEAAGPPMLRDLGVGDLAYILWLRRHELTPPKDGVVDKSRLLLWWHLLLAARRRQCTNTEDKIYSTLGMIRSVLPSNVTGPFSADPNLSPEEVFTQTAAYLLASMHDLALLSVVEDRDYRKMEELPSWCPDFSVNGWGYPVGSLLLDYDASGAVVTQDEEARRPRFEGSTMKVHGMKLGEIVTMVSCEADGDHVLGFLEMLSALDKTYELTGEDNVEALGITLAFNVSSFKNKGGIPKSEFNVMLRSWLLQRLTEYLVLHRRSDDTYHRDLVESVVNKLQPSPVLPTFDEIERNSKRPDFMFIMDHELEFTYLLKEKFDVRSLFYTDNGHLGVCRTGASIGNEIWIFDRGTVPYALEKEVDGSYDFRGDCYVHGVMQGEICDVEARKRFEEISIN